MLKHQNEALPLIQSTVDTLAVATQWEEAAFIKALELGLEGCKRKNRYEATTDDYIRRFLQSSAYDIFEVSVRPSQEQRISLDDIKDAEQFFSQYLSFLESYYDKVSDTANKFVAPLCLKKLACPLYDRAECLLDEIIEVRRRIKRSKICGWQHDLYIYQQSWHNQHDSMELKEEQRGYNL